MACRHLLTIQGVIEILQGKGEKKKPKHYLLFHSKVTKSFVEREKQGSKGRRKTLFKGCGNTLFHPFPE